MQDEMKEDLGDKGDKSQIKEKHDPEINRKKLIEADRRKIELWKGLKDHFKEQLKNELTFTQDKIEQIKNQKTIFYRVSLDSVQLDKFTAEKYCEPDFKVTMVLYSKQSDKKK